MNDFFVLGHDKSYDLFVLGHDKSDGEDEGVCGANDLFVLGHDKSDEQSKATQSRGGGKEGARLAVENGQLQDSAAGLGSQSTQGRRGRSL
jgi:hypothetical protein